MENTKIISKVENLLKLAGNNPEAKEAEAALLKAQELMAKYNLEMSQFQDQPKEKKEVIEKWIRGGQSCQWMRKLAMVLADNFRCSLLVGTGYGLVFVGLKDDVGICTRVFEFASHSLDRNMKKLRRQYRKQGLSTEGISGDYAMGFINGLQDKYKEQVEKNNWGLVLVKDNAVMEHTNSISSEKKAKPGKGLSRAGDAGLYAKGYLDGKNLGEPQKAIQTA